MKRYGHITRTNKKRSVVRSWKPAGNDLLVVKSLVHCMFVLQLWECISAAFNVVCASLLTVLHFRECISAVFSVIIFVLHIRECTSAV